MDELRNCPFCGYDLIAEGKDTRDYFVAWCLNCGCFGPNETSKERARQMWNMRRPYDRLADTMEAEQSTDNCPLCHREACSHD